MERAGLLPARFFMSKKYVAEADSKVISMNDKFLLEYSLAGICCKWRNLLGQPLLLYDSCSLLFFFIPLLGLL
jgi:hypothetical protein